MFNKLFGRVRLQRFFEKLHIVSLRGQNYYNAVNLEWTGEKNVVKYIEKKEEKNVSFTLFDIGSHHGEYFDLFSIPFKAKMYTHFFEPQEGSYKILLKKYNSLKNVVINHIAIGNYTKKQIDLYTCSKNNLLATTFPFKLEDFNGNLSLDGKETVDITTLDKYLAEKGIQQIDMLKLDVEGMEYQCLEGCLNYINKKKIKYIQFEYCFINMANRNYFYDFWKLLSPNYKLYRILVDGLYEIKEYHINLEVMGPINYLAELK